MNVVAQTERLRLRRYSEGDADLLVALLGDPVTMQHWPEPLTTEQARAWFERATAAYGTAGYGRFAVELHDGAYVGDAGILRSDVAGALENDLGYIIDHRYWRRGYGLEAARACLEYGLASGQRRIVANMAADNFGSVRVAQQLGFTLEARFRNPRNRDKETQVFAWRAATDR